MAEARGGRARHPTGGLPTSLQETRVSGHPPRPAPHEGVLHAGLCRSLMSSTRESEGGYQAASTLANAPRQYTRSAPCEILKCRRVP